MNYQSEHTSRPLLFRTLRGQSIAVRQATAADTALLADLLGQLSARSRYLRYMRPGDFSAEMIWSEAERMTRGNPLNHTTLVATMPPQQAGEAIGVAELVRRQANPSTGELALVVRDDQQQQGIGSFLLQRLIRAAQYNGILCLIGHVLAENRIMLGLIRALNLPYTSTTSYGETQVLIQVPRPAPSRASAAGFRLASNI
jgi:acetyltransferase